jgi:hypothetical protein
MAMPSEAEKYEQYARDCVRLAGRAATAELREQLLDLARVWMDAAMTEQDAVAGKSRPASVRPGI